MKTPKKKANVKKPISKDLPNKDLVTLGRRIQSLRVKKGYTNYEYFAYENDIPRAQYGRYEKGEDLRYSSLVRVVKAMGMSLKEFFSEGFD
jgi:transcriptional regulator with XRE-family HTH domain